MTKPLPILTQVTLAYLHEEQKALKEVPEYLRRTAQSLSPLTMARPLPSDTIEIPMREDPK